MTTQTTVHPETNEGAAPELKARLRHMVESGKSQVTEWKGGFQDGVREKPIQSILIAAAVGALFGLIVGRRS